MKARDPDINRLRQILGAPSIPNIGEKLDPRFRDQPPKTPDIFNVPSPPDFQMRPFPRSVPPLPPGINPDMPPEFNPYRPQGPKPFFPPPPNRQPPSAPRLADPAVPDRPSMAGSVEPSTTPPASDAPHWLAQSIPPMSWASQSPSSPPASDTPSWLDPGPVGKALRRVLGFPE